MLIDYFADFASLSEGIVLKQPGSAMKLDQSVPYKILLEKMLHAADIVSPMVIPPPAIAFPHPTSGLTLSRSPVNLSLRNLHKETFVVKQLPIIKPVRVIFSLKPCVNWTGWRRQGRYFLL